MLHIVECSGRSSCGFRRFQST